MIGAGPRLDRRRRFVAAALALVVGVALLPLNWELARAEVSSDITLVFHGSIMGKIAPCG